MGASIGAGTKGSVDVELNIVPFIDLMSCLTAFLGNWIMNGLPQPYHPAFASKAFERVTDDKFFIMIEAKDSKFDRERTKALLQATGATLVEELED